MDEKMKINDAELDAVSGGETEEEEKNRKERSLHGTIEKDVFGNVKFTDKTGKWGTFSAADWEKLKTQWQFTGNPEYFMETINYDELKGVLNGL